MLLTTSLKLRESNLHFRQKNNQCKTTQDNHNTQSMMTILVKPSEKANHDERCSSINWHISRPASSFHRHSSYLASSDFPTHYSLFHYLTVTHQISWCSDAMSNISNSSLYIQSIQACPIHKISKLFYTFRIFLALSSSYMLYQYSRHF